MNVKIHIKRISYKIKGLVLFGIVVTTKKNLENCPIDVEIEKVEVFT